MLDESSRDHPLSHRCFCFAFLRACLCRPLGPFKCVCVWGGHWSQFASDKDVISTLIRVGSFELCHPSRALRLHVAGPWAVMSRRRACSDLISRSLGHVQIGCSCHRARRTRVALAGSLRARLRVQASNAELGAFTTEAAPSGPRRSRPSDGFARRAGPLAVLAVESSVMVGAWAAGPIEGALLFRVPGTDQRLWVPRHACGLPTGA